MAFTCQTGQEGEIYQRYPHSVQTLQNEDDRGLMEEIGLPYSLLIVKNNTLPKPLHHSKSRTIENSNSYVLPHNYIIRWNCRGLRSNREDMELIVLIYSPPAICLKETLLKRDQTQTFKRYSAYYKNGIHGHTGQIKSSLFLSWYMYNNINTQSYSVP